jgi:electron transfer flavoprotein alpha subunit
MRSETADYKGLWVVTQLDASGLIKKSSLELLSKAKELAKTSGEQVTAIVMGDHASDELAAAISSVGTDQIVCIPEGIRIDYDTDARASLIAEAVEMRRPSIVLFAATEEGRDLAPRVAGKIKTGLTADCTGLDLDDDGNLLQVRPTFGGNILATIMTPYHRPQMATVRPNVMDVKIRAGGKAEISMFSPGKREPQDTKCELIERIRNEISYRDVSEASLIIAGGYGLKTADGFHWVYKLASKLNAAPAATRKAVDEGWAPMSIQVGQTGKSVAPELYIAFGISGALQHSIAIRNARKIIAVNNDPAAPIFSFCDVPILGDAAEVIEKVYEKMR